MENIENNLIQQNAEEATPMMRVAHPNKKIGVLMSVVVVLYLLMSVATAFFREQVSATGFLIMSTVTVTILSIGFPSLVHIFAGKKSGDRYNLCKLHLNQILPCILFGIGLCFAMLVAANIIQAAYMSAGVDLSKSSGNVTIATGTPTAFIISTLCIAAAPAVCEELLCRSAVLYSFRSLGLRRAALWSGIYFALLHADLTSLPVYIVLGYIFGLIAYKSRSVLSTMIVHFVYNFTIICLQSIPTGEVETEVVYTLASPEMWMAVGVFAMIAAIFIVPATIMFKINCRKNDKKEAAKREQTVINFLDDYNGIGEPRAPFGTVSLIFTFLILIGLTLSMGIYEINMCIV